VNPMDLEIMCLVCGATLFAQRTKNQPSDNSTIAVCVDPCTACLEAAAADGAKHGEAS